MSPHPDQSEESIIRVNQSESSILTCAHSSTSLRPYKWELWTRLENADLASLTLMNSINANPLWSPSPVIFLGSLTADNSPNVRNNDMISFLVAWTNQKSFISVNQSELSILTWNGMFLTRILVQALPRSALLFSAAFLSPVSLVDLFSSRQWSASLE